MWTKFDDLVVGDTYDVEIPSMGFTGRFTGYSLDEHGERVVANFSSEGWVEAWSDAKFWLTD